MKKIKNEKVLSAEEQTQLFRDTFMKGFTREQQDFILNLKEDDDGGLSLEGVTKQIKNCTFFNKSKTIKNKKNMKATIIAVETEDLEKILNPCSYLPPDDFEKMTEQAKELIPIFKERIKKDILSDSNNIDITFGNQFNGTKPSDIEDITTRICAVAALFFNHKAWSEAEEGNTTSSIIHSMAYELCCNEIYDTASKKDAGTFWSLID